MRQSDDDLLWLAAFQPCCDGRHLRSRITSGSLRLGQGGATRRFLRRVNFSLSLRRYSP
jgi:hypothetical protein